MTARPDSHERSGTRQPRSGRGERQRSEHRILERGAGNRALGCTHPPPRAAGSSEARTWNVLEGSSCAAAGVRDGGRERHTTAAQDGGGLSISIGGPCNKRGEPYLFKNFQQDSIRHPGDVGHWWLLLPLEKQVDSTRSPPC